MNEKTLPSRLSYSSLVFGLFGGIVGVIISCFYGPRVISWWFEPPVEVGYNCRPATDWAMSRLMLVQGLSLVTGAVLATAIKRLFSRRKAE